MHMEAAGLHLVHAESCSPGQLRLESVLKLFNPRKPEFNPSMTTLVSDTGLYGRLKVRVFLLSALASIGQENSCKTALACERVSSQCRALQRPAGVRRSRWPQGPRLHGGSSQLSFVPTVLLNRVLSHGKTELRRSLLSKLRPDVP